MGDRFTLSWKNAEVVVQFFPEKLVVTLYANNVCVDQKEIPYDEVKVEKNCRAATGFPTKMELGKPYKFVYGLDANLVIKPVELTDEEKRTCRSCGDVAAKIEHLDDAGFCELCRQDQRAYDQREDKQV